MHRTHSSESLGPAAAPAIMTHLAGQQQGKGQGGGTPPVMHRSASGSHLGPAGVALPVPASSHAHDRRVATFPDPVCFSGQARNTIWVMSSGRLYWPFRTLLYPSARELGVPAATGRHVAQPQLVDRLRRECTRSTSLQDGALHSSGQPMCAAAASAGQGGGPSQDSPRVPASGSVLPVPSPPPSMPILPLRVLPAPKSVGLPAVSRGPSLHSWLFLHSFVPWFHMGTGLTRERGVQSGLSSR